MRNAIRVLCAFLLAVFATGSVVGAQDKSMPDYSSWDRKVLKIDADKDGNTDLVTEGYRKFVSNEEKYMVLVLQNNKGENRLAFATSVLKELVNIDTFLIVNGNWIHCPVDPERISAERARLCWAAKESLVTELGGEDKAIMTVSVAVEKLTELLLK